MTTQTDTQVVFTPEASETIISIEQHVLRLAYNFGIESEEFKQARDTWHQALLSILRLGGRIIRDGELALMGLSFITYGVIFHPTHAAFCNETDERGKFNRVWRDKQLVEYTLCPTHGEIHSYDERRAHFTTRVVEIDGVKAGTWSVHS